MKKFLLALGLLIGASSFYTSVEAQNISVNINIGRQPAWGPVGYDYVGYYYFPDLDVYYDVNGGLFVYSDRGRWISSRYLPYGYRDYDLYGLYKVVLNINDPWRYNRIHYRDYARYRGIRTQYVIRDSRDYRYRDSRRNSVVWYSPNYRPNHNRPNHNRPNYNYSRPSDSRPNRPNYNGSRDNNRPNNNNSSRPSYNGSKESSRPNNNNSIRPSYNGQSSSRPNSSVNRPSNSSSNSTSRPSTNNTNRPSSRNNDTRFVENRTNDSRSNARESSRTANNRTERATNSRARN